jgi:hypothetical protein
MATTNSKYILGVYDDEAVLLHAIPKVRASGTKITEVFSPFPVHGIDDALGIPRTRLPIAAFFFGLTGTSLALLMQTYMLVFDWPMIIGGKPHFSLPAFIPVTFELTVLLTAFGMVITFLLISRLRPRANTKVLDPRSTDDKFIMAIEVKPNMDIAQVHTLLRQNGAIEVNEKEVAA